MGGVRPLPQGYKPREYEPEILEYWREARIYEKLRRISRDKPKFYFLDGPPYPSSDTPHIGTVWNKVLKDAVIRFWRARGYWVNDQPGYDCHGLPIEVKVEQKLGFSSKKDIEEYGVDKFVEKCREFALSNVESMTRHFEEFGVSMDWDKPYLTLTPEYVQAAWWLVKKADERGLLERGVKVVHWCPRCETTLADYEVSEYAMLTDPSIYVKFPLKERRDHYLLIWTTTPWTLPANVAVMVHPDLEYAWVEAGGERLLIAKSRVEAVMKEAGIREFKVVSIVKGRELEGLEYVHPLLEEVEVQRGLAGAHRVVLSTEYVSAEEGTGLVHCAPGHGEEDYEVGLQYELPVIAPVDDRGFFTHEAGKYAGKYVREANSEIIRDLREKGLLFHEGVLTHKYPICWRCKTPLILRATPQWYIRVAHMKDRFLEEAAKVKWVPDWAGYARFRNWLQGLRDWVISRQRYWGTPVPIWICTSCGHRVVVGSLAELEKLTGRKLDLKDLHRPWIDEITFECPICRGVMRRVPDVLDVWLDSGVAFYASLGYPLEKDKFEKLWPVDFITEGHDQIAGWFFSLLRCSLIAFNTAPYRVVLMHGFALDERGREMHKSLGNYVAPREVLEFDKGGRDVLRWYVLRNTIWEDLKFSWSRLAEVFDDLNIVWNVYVFAATYMSLDEFDPSAHPLEEYLSRMRLEDKWLLSRVERLVLNVTRWMENFEVHRAARALRDFLIEDVSRWYVRLVRPRVWIEREDPDKLAAYVALYYALRKFLVLASPIIPFITEKIYVESFRISEEEPESIHMLPWPKVREELIDDELERDMEVIRRLIERVAAARMRAGLKLRQPLPTLYVLTEKSEVRKAVERLRDILAVQANVKRVEVLPPSRKREFTVTRVKPVYRAIGPIFRDEAGRVLQLLGQCDPAQLKRELEEKGEALLSSPEGVVYRLTPSMVEFEEEWASGYVGEDFDSGMVIIDTRIGPEELAEGLARDILRRIQFMRKLMNLPVDSFIEVTLYAPTEVRELLSSRASYIAGEARARDLKIVMEEDEVEGDLVREWEVQGFRVKIGVRTVA